MSAATAASVELRIPRRAEFVRIARWMTTGVAAQLGFTMDIVKDIEVALGEACTNAVEHVKQGRKNEILVRFTMDDRCLAIEVFDYGPGFSIDGDCEGLGLMLMRLCMDKVEVACDAETGGCVRLVKYRDGS